MGLSYQWAYIDPNIKDALPAEMLVDYVRVYQQVGASVEDVGGWLVGWGIQPTRSHPSHEEERCGAHTCL